MSLEQITWKLGLAWAALIVVGSPAAAQVAGYVDLAQVMQESDAAKQANRSFSAQFSRREADLRRRELELRRRMQDLNAGAGGAASTEGENRRRDVLFARERLLAERRILEDEETRSRREHWERISEALRTSVRRLAEQRGLDFVIDDAAYIRPAQDVTRDVIKDMNRATRSPE